MCGNVARIGEIDKKGIQNVRRKLEWKRSLGRLRCRWEDNIKMDLKK
jgi:hypothetical protein